MRFTMCHALFGACRASEPWKCPFHHRLYPAPFEATAITVGARSAHWRVKGAVVVPEAPTEDSADRIQ